MNNNDYSFFAVLAEELNISRAAKRLYVSPQALSKRIIKLEKQYGIPLFERKPTFKLTYAGERLLQYFNDLEILEAKARDEIKDIANKNSGQINVGISSVRRMERLSEIFVEYNKKYPHIQIILRDNHVTELLKLLLERKLDFMISVSTIDDVETQHIELGSENTYLLISDSCLKKYCSSNYNWLIASERDSAPVSIYEFSSCPFAMSLPETRRRQKVDTVFSRCNISPNIILSANNIDLRMEYVSEGSGATVIDCLPREAAEIKQVFGNSDIHIFSLLELSNITTVKISYRKDKYIPQYTRALIEMIKENY